MVQDHVGESPWGFKSLLRHHLTDSAAKAYKNPRPLRRFLFFVEARPIGWGRG